MAVFDQWSLLDDAVSLSAGQVIGFSIQSTCMPFGAPTDTQVIAGFASGSLSIESESQAFFTSITPALNQWDIKATVKEVITVGQLRAQILAAINVISTQTSIPCYDFSVVDNAIKLLVEPGTGINSPTLPSLGGLNLSLGLVAAAVVVVVLFAIYKDIEF